MREIKFRAWLKWGDKKIIKVVTIDWEDIGQFITDDTNTKHFFDQIELMQYTGLKDKNGKEIYEGDILEYISAIGGYKCTEKVIFDKITASFLPIFRIHTCTFPFGLDCKIIGNIYENKELLK